MKIVLTKEEKKELKEFIKENNLSLFKEEGIYYIGLSYNDFHRDFFKVCFSYQFNNLTEIYSCMKKTNGFQLEIRDLRNRYLLFSMEKEFLNSNNKEVKIKLK